MEHPVRLRWTDGRRASRAILSDERPGSVYGLPIVFYKRAAWLGGELAAELELVGAAPAILVKRARAAGFTVKEGT